MPPKDEFFKRAMEVLDRESNYDKHIITLTVSEKKKEKTADELIETIYQDG